MPVKRRKGKRRKRIDADTWAILNDEPLPADGDAWVEFELRPIRGHTKPREVWERCRDDVLTAFIAKHAGRRPSRWWYYDASESRKRLGGVGTLRSEFAPNLHLGVPEAWETVEIADPPRFESQAAALKRFGLLTADERKVLSAADFEPESIFDIGILSAEDLEDE